MFILLLENKEKKRFFHNNLFIHKSYFFIFSLVNRFCTGCRVVMNRRPEVAKPSDSIANTGKYTL